MFSSKREHKVYIEDILNAIDKIEKYTSGIKYEDFENISMIADAVIRNFEIIGEAASNIPEEIKMKYQEVEWKECVGFRNFLIHGYFMVSLEMVWDTIHKNLPQLKEHIKDIRE